MRRFSAFLVCVCAVVLLTSHPAVGGVTTRVSVSSDGAQGNYDSYVPSMSADGRYVAFMSCATNLVTGDTNGHADVFVYDRVTGHTERVSVASDGTQGNGDSSVWNGNSPAISADGRYVGFSSDASNLVPGDSNGCPDTFVHDRLTGQTERVSVATSGAQGNNWSGVWPISISADGRYVAFTSDASNLVTGDTNDARDVFVRDRLASQTTRVSVASDGTQAAGWESHGYSYTGYCAVAISADGRYVAFDSCASNLVADDTNRTQDMFLHDRHTGRTTRVSVASDGAQGNSGSGYCGASLSADGRYVAFPSVASNLVVGDTNGCRDVFLHDCQTGQTIRVSVASDGIEGNGQSGGGVGGLSVSADGRYIAFYSYASNLVAGDVNGACDIYVRDRLSGTTERVSLSTGGLQGNSGSYAPSVSADGRYVVFRSPSCCLVPGDTNGDYDVFVRDRWGSAEPPGGVPGYTLPPGAHLSVRNPYADSVAKRVKGQLHCHFYNDAETELWGQYVGALGFGSLPPELLLASYAALGYDFVCITEHNHCTSDPLFSPALFVRYCEEVTTSFGHVLAIAENPAQPSPTRQEERRYIPWDGANSFGEVIETSPCSVTDVVNTIKDRNGLAIIAHPCLSKYPVSADEIWKARPSGISVYTAAAFTNSESRWNELLTAGMFIPTDSSGRMLLFGATEDDYTPPITPYAHGRTWVIAELDSDDVTQTNIVRALKNGRYWSYRSFAPHFGTGPVLHLTTGTSGEGKPVIQVSSDRLVDDIAFVYRKKDTGTTVAHNWGPRYSAEYTCVGDEIFVRAVVTKDDIGVYSQPVAVVWEWTSGGTGMASFDKLRMTGGGVRMSGAPLAGTPSDLVLTCALPEELPEKMPPLGYIGRAYFTSTTSGTYPEGSTLTLSYEGLDVTPCSTSNLAIYRWDSSASAWVKLASTGDIGNALVTAPLTQAGLYTNSAEIIGDTTAPTVTIHSPANGATLSGPDVIGVQAYGNVGVLRTTFYLGDQELGTDSTSWDGFTCEYDFSKKVAGTYTLKVAAEDVSGNTGQAEVTVNVDSTGAVPTVSITSPSNGAELQGTATITGTCSDNSLVAGVFLLSDGVPVGEASVTDTNWTYDLDTNLLANGPHTLSAQAMDEDLNTTETAISVTVSSPTLGNLAEAKALDDGERARVSGRVVTFGDPGFEGGFYVEEQQRFSGVRVEGSSVPAQGDMVSVSGIMSTESGEREIVGADVLVTSSGNPIPGPLGMRNIWLGGIGVGDYPYNQTAGFGLQNLGLLVRTWGRVTRIGDGYLYVDDGSAIRDGTFTGAEENVGVRVICDPAGYAVNDLISVTGISSCFETPSSQLARRILTRGSSDVFKVIEP